MLKHRSAQYGGPHQGCGRVVEVEDRPHERGRGAHLRPAATGGVPACTPTTPLPCGRPAGTTPDRQLVPVLPKAYSGLTDAEIAQVDAIIRKTTRESFGPCAAWSHAGVRAGLRGHCAQPAPQKAALPCAFRACCAGGGTNPWPRPTPLQTLAALLPVKAAHERRAAKRWMAARNWQPFRLPATGQWQAMAEGRFGLLHATTGVGKTYAGVPRRI